MEMSEDRGSGSGHNRHESTEQSRESERLIDRERDSDESHLRRKEYHGDRVESILGYLKKRFSLRRRSDWLPFYELETASRGSADNTLHSSRRKPILSIILSCFYSVLVVIGLFSIVGFFAGYVAFRDDDVFWPDWDSPGHYGENISHYPTDFTRGVTPVPCHSHNDYWRRIPFFDAVHAGCSSVEADVWHFHDELYVGHAIPALSHNRTFRSLYINPILSVLNRQNPVTEFSKGSKNGVFDEQFDQTLVLLVDFKTNGVDLFPVVEEQLSPLRDQGYLTHYNGTDLIQGAVTVVGTGNTPFESVLANNTYRDIFFDAPLKVFTTDGPNNESLKYNYTNSFYASVSAYEAVGFPWLGHYTDRQVDKLRDHILGAQKAGLKARYWDTPAWPKGLRNYIWTLLVKQGTDYLNVDDIKEATHGTWGTWG